MQLKKNCIRLLLPLFMLLLSSCQWIQYVANDNRSSQSTFSSERTQARVTKVVDGDTIHVQIGSNKEKVRLLLIDTPEYTTQKEPFGKEAKNLLRDLLLRQVVELEYDIEKRDRYGRLLAYVYFNGQSVQKQLLENGLAEVKVYLPNQKYEKQFRQYEYTAQQKNINIWSPK